MKSVKFNIQATARGNNVTFTLEVTHSKVGVNHRFTAAILESSEPIVWGDMPTGYYPDGKAVSKGEINNTTISFGAGEVERQGTSPFCVYPAKSERNKKDRIMFKLPVDRQELLKMF